jgi:hypothetical protein
MVHKESALGGQTILHTTVMFYGDCMKMCEDFTLKFGDKLTKNNTTVIPTHPTRLTWPSATFLFPQLKMKLSGRHFDTI